MRSFALCMLLACGSALAQVDVPKPVMAGLAVGDKAPALEVDRWVKGEAVKAFAADTVYVIDCWATWCGPCIRGIPHLTRVQAKYKGKLRVIGVSVWESGFDKVKKFVDDQGDKMGYTVCTDKQPPLPVGTAPDSREARENASKGKVAVNWLKAAGATGIPTVFVVDQKGFVAWIGHPSEMDGPLARIVDGTYDLKKATELWKAKKADSKFSAELTQMLRNRQYKEAFAFARMHIDTRWKHSSGILNELAWTIVDPKGAVKDKDLDLAMKAAVRANKITEGKNAAILDTLARVHFLKGGLDKALELQTKAVSLAEGEMKKELEAALAEYKAKKAATEKK